MSRQLWGIGWMSFGGALASGAGGSLGNAIRHHTYARGETAVMACVFLVGLAIVVRGTRLYLGAEAPDSPAQAP